MTDALRVKGRTLQVSASSLLRFTVYRHTIKFVIRSFRCSETEKVFKGIRTREFQAVEKTVIRKLFQLHSARSLNDLRSPGNSLEAMTKERVGQYSIRINDQYRLCFRWENAEAHDVEIVDYH